MKNLKFPDRAGNISFKRKTIKPNSSNVSKKRISKMENANPNPPCTVNPPIVENSFAECKRSDELIATELVTPTVMINI
jgi:hypothetical protein